MIDPKKIESLRSEAQNAVGQTGYYIELSPEFTLALLAEREHLLSALAEEREENEGWKNTDEIQRAELEKAAAEREEMLEVLREVEWSGVEFDIDSSDACCPECRALKIVGKHGPRCRLAALLKGAG